ncbi:MAG TPA: hypothetical protein VNK03_05435 [Gammaproteobacteria bacterium]|nr:hypothetical protein [Gammaproteobacteria bacterium]
MNRGILTIITVVYITSFSPALLANAKGGRGNNGYGMGVKHAESTKHPSINRTDDIERISEKIKVKDEKSAKRLRINKKSHKHKGRGHNRDHHKMRNPNAATPAVPGHNEVSTQPAIPGNPKAKENIIENRAQQ